MTSAKSEGLRLTASEAKDSRGRPTVEVTASIGGVSTVGDVPAGASKGEDEAQTVPVPEAIKNIHEIILPMMQKANLNLATYEGLRSLENMMIDRAGENFKDLGANATLPVSRALWRAAAKLNGMELWQFIQKHEPKLASKDTVHFYMNIFNGGLHALKKADGEVLGKDRIDIQEIMVVPVSAKTYAEQLMVGEKIDAALKELLLSKWDAKAVTRADEAGFSVKGLGDSTEAIGLVWQAVEKAGYVPGKDVKMALDVAASSFYDSATKRYKFRGEELTSEQMIKYLVDFADRYSGKVLSIEDGLDENDWAAWATLTAEMKKRNVLTIGDDLFVTQKTRLDKGIANKSASAILIKVNQNGTVGGTLDVMKQAKEAGMQCVVSHRSGETLDDSIADLAYATGSLGLKTGDPQPVGDFQDPKTWVRRAKYLRMLAIEKSLS